MIRLCPKPACVAVFHSDEEEANHHQCLYLDVPREDLRGLDKMKVQGGSIEVSNITKKTSFGFWFTYFRILGHISGNDVIYLNSFRAIYDQKPFTRIATVRYLL